MIPPGTIKRSLEKLTRMVADGFQNVHLALAEFRNEVNRRFDGVHHRLDTIERRLGTLKRELTNLRDDFRKFDTRVTHLARIPQIDCNFTDLVDRF